MNRIATSRAGSPFRWLHGLLHKFAHAAPTRPSLRCFPFPGSITELRQTFRGDRAKLAATAGCLKGIRMIELASFALRLLFGQKFAQAISGSVNTTAGIACARTRGSAVMTSTATLP